MMVKHDTNYDGRNPCHDSDAASRLGEFSISGRGYGDGQIGTDSANSEGCYPDTDNANRGTERDVDLGKILGRLAALEEKYNEYVGAHQERLKTRLVESEVSQRQFNQEVTELRSDIYAILTSE